MERERGTRPRDARNQLQRATSIVVYADETGRGDHARQLATQVAGRNGARLILYALEAYTPLAVPLPTEWSADQTEGEPEGPLTPQQLVQAGRPELARMVEEATARGARAGAWLPRSGGVDDMVAYARDQRADVVLLPEEMGEPNLLDRLVRDTREEAARQDRSVMPVLLVTAGGEVRHAGEESAEET